MRHAAQRRSNDRPVGTKLKRSLGYGSRGRAGNVSTPAPVSRVVSAVLACRRLAPMAGKLQVTRRVSSQRCGHVLSISELGRSRSPLALIAIPPYPAVDFYLSGAQARKKLKRIP